MRQVEIRENERIDDLQIKGYHIIQNKNGFCYGCDAVLLSDYVKPKKGGRAMDLCTGTGVVPLLMEAKYEFDELCGLEYQKECAQMAMRSVEMNDLSEKIHIYEGDVCRVAEEYPAQSFEYVTCNPPYMTGSHGLTNKDYSMAVSRHEILCTLEDVVRAANWLLKPQGHFVMVHRPFRLAEIISCLKEYKLEPKRMRLVYPSVHKEPTMVLIEAVKGGKQRITVDPPLIMYQEDGTYTEEIRKIYGGEI